MRPNQGLAPSDIHPGLDGHLMFLLTQIKKKKVFYSILIVLILIVEGGEPEGEEKVNRPCKFSVITNEWTDYNSLLNTVLPSWTFGRSFV